MKTQSNLLHVRLSSGVVGMLCLIWAGQMQAESTVPTSDVSPSKQAEVIPWDQIGAKAGANYTGEGLAVSRMESGARLSCVFQRLEGEATAAGLWLVSTASDESPIPSGGKEGQREEAAHERFRVVAHSLKRGGSESHDLAEWTEALPGTGTVELADKLVRFVRPLVVEEYSVSVDGVRQDFKIDQKPPGHGPLRLALAVTGAKAESTSSGVQLVLEKSGRKIAYSRLKVSDATGKELPARMEVEEDSEFRVPSSKFDFAVVVEDEQAVYPVRIDPTFSDANWISMGGLPGTDDTVSAAVVDGSGNLFIGGEFLVVGDVAANRIAKWNGSSWRALGSGVNGPVRALAVSGNDLFVGGAFFSAGGGLASRIAKWNGSGWSALGSGVNNIVYALAVSGSDLYAGGNFRIAGGLSANYIAKWNGSSWSPLGSGMNNTVYALAASGSELYAGGYFATAGGNPANYIAKWNGCSWGALGSGMNNIVYALAVSGSDLYAGGHFTTAGGTSANYIAKWSESSWSALGSGMAGSDGTNPTAVYALAVSGANLYAAGFFRTAGEVSATNIAKWDGSNWSSLGSTMGGTYPRVYALAVSGNDLSAGGSFTTVGGVSARNVAKWNASNWSALGSGIGGVDFPAIQALVVSGSDLYAGGNFTAAGGPANYIAKWNGSSWSALGSGMNNIVYALAVSGSDLYAGGDFTTAGGIPANHIAKWDGSSWSALGSGMSGVVRALAVLGNDLYAGGVFTTAGEVSANQIAKWDGSSWSALGSGMEAASYTPYVYALVVSGGDLYAAGGFTTAGGVLANSIAKWDGTGWSALGSGLSGSVAALAVSGSDLYAGGQTLGTTYGNTTVAKWDGNTWSDLSGLFVSPIPFASVRTLAVSGTDLYAGGYFTTAGGNPANYIAKWDGTGWSGLGSGMNNMVLALAVSGSGLYAGGTFTTAGGKVSGYAAQWGLPNSAPTLLDTAVTLNAVTEDTGAPAGPVGTLVSSLVDLNPPAGGRDNVSDPDPNAITGIAVIGADTANGTWFYSIDDGASWLALGTVNGASARVLAANASTRLYFQSTPNFSGTVAGALTFRAWDQTDSVASGTAGINTSTNGGTTAYSTDTDVAAITITNVNDPPVITGQNPISTAFNTARPLVFADLLVSDIDDSYPTGFSLTVSDGSNYTRSGNTITPALGFYGTLIVPAQLNDGAADSNEFKLAVTVNPDPEFVKVATRIVPEPGGGNRISFLGNPAWKYAIQFTPTLSPPNWQTLGTRTADANGHYDLVHIPPPGTMGFYRSVFP